MVMDKIENMPKQIVIEVPDWVDEDIIKEIIQREISARKEDKLIRLEELLDELPERDIMITFLYLHCSI